MCLFTCVCPSLSLSGDKWSAGVLSDPRRSQTGAFAIGSGSGVRRQVARSPAGAARRPQWPRDALCCNATARLWTLSGKRCDTNLQGNVLRTDLDFFFSNNDINLKAEIQ